METEAGIGMGSNLGDALSHLRDALQALQQIDGTRLLARSSVYLTEPVDVPPAFAHLMFLNAVAIFSVTLDVAAWSEAVHAIETRLQRVRTGVRHEPRTIDLDLLYFGGLVRNEPRLRLPHPQCFHRRFVCQPLAEVRPDWTPPGGGPSASEVLRALPDKPAVVRGADQW